MSDLSYKNRRYTIVEYDPNWKKIYEEEKSNIELALKDITLEIEHIGSTAVPGMAGKPIIDILVIVKDISEVGAVSSDLEKIGYKALGEYVMEGALLFIKEENGMRKINLHIFQDGHYHVEEMLKLRDYFRTHEDEVKEYSSLKLKLFEMYPNNYTQYRENKDLYINELKKRI